MGGGAGKGMVNPSTSSMSLASGTKRRTVAPDYAGPTILSADVGGTSSRLHLILPPPKRVRTDRDYLVPPERRIHTAKYQNDKYDSFTDIVKTFLAEAGLEKPPLLACLAVAGVVVDNKVTFVNNGWTIDGGQIQETLGIRKVTLINDFVAQGYGILTLDRDKECDGLQVAQAIPSAPIALIGAGTGMGEAFLTNGISGDYEVWPSEGGHAEFAPRQDGSSALQFEMIQYMQIKYSAKARVSVERICSGKGLANIYEFLAWKYPERVNKAVHREFIGPVEGPRLFDPAVITRAATAGTCALCRQAVDMWCSAYGSEAGVVALTYMPFGGLFVTGGVTSKLKDFLLPKKGQTNHFMEAFHDKGRVTAALMRIPVYMVRGEDLGERGAMLKAQRVYYEEMDLRLCSRGHM